jgi:hypothetical protein
MASSSTSSPCAACKFLRRKCTSECVFAPYFPPDQPQKFANVHKIFGASNITKLLNELSPHQREDAVNSLAYEADARVKDPVYGCVGAISLLQRQVAQLQNELAIAHSDLARYSAAGAACGPMQQVAVGVTPHQGPQAGAGHSSSLQGIAMVLPQGNQSRGEQQAAQLLTREQLIDLAREPPHLTREQIMELARVGGGSYDAGLAALGLQSHGARAHGPLAGSYSSSRTGGAGGDHSRGVGRHTSPQ